MEILLSVKIEILAVANKKHCHTFKYHNHQLSS